MKKNDAFDILVSKIKNAKSIIIFGHKNLDADSMCSGLALAQLIKLNYGKDCLCLYDGNMPDSLHNIPMRESMRYYAKVDIPESVDLVFVLDYGTIKNLGALSEILPKSKFKIEFDHHKNDNCVGDLCINDVAASSVGEIIYTVAEKLDWRRDETVNDLIALSVITDTGFFKYARRGVALRIMADLVDSGVNIEHLANLLNNKSRKSVLTEASVASRAQFMWRGRVAIAVVDRSEYKKLDGRSDTILNLLGQIHGVEYIILLKQQKENQISVSLRSKLKPIDEIATALGGGGHAYAAGAVVQDSLDNVRAMVLDLFKEMLK